MNKLDTIKAAVAAHFAAKEAADNEMKRAMQEGDMGIAHRYEYNLHYAPQHAAMLMLRDLLPLLDAAVAWDTLPVDAPASAFANTQGDLSDEIAKLLKAGE